MTGPAYLSLPAGADPLGLEKRFLPATCYRVCLAVPCFFLCLTGKGILFLSAIQQMKMKEIAEILGTSCRNILDVLDRTYRRIKRLLENGVIPCEDSGKQTRRFQIRRSEVADFLRRQDTGELNSIIPVGAFNSNNTLHNISLPNTEPEELFSFLLEEWADEPDMLTTKQAAELTGYNDTTINNWAADGKIKAVNYYGKNLISKESLVKYLASVEGQCIVRPSQKHQEIIQAFTGREQNSGMVFGSMTLY